MTNVCWLYFVTIHFFGVQCVPEPPIFDVLINKNEQLLSIITMLNKYSRTITQDDTLPAAQ
ncbi:MAG TPA: hypothetical protein PKE17_15170, partial [Saprospiraceae bacterium]|nr:hypothetical protein [Saprospiraceae bacterium]